MELPGITQDDSIQQVANANTKLLTGAVLQGQEQEQAALKTTLDMYYRMPSKLQSQFGEQLKTSPKWKQITAKYMPFLQDGELPKTQLSAMEQAELELASVPQQVEILRRKAEGTRDMRIQEQEDSQETQAKYNFRTVNIGGKEKLMSEYDIKAELDKGTEIVPVDSDGPTKAQKAKAEEAVMDIQSNIGLFQERTKNKNFNINEASLLLGPIRDSLKELVKASGKASAFSSPEKIKTLSPEDKVLAKSIMFLEKFTNPTLAFGKKQKGKSDEQLLNEKKDIVAFANTPIGQQLGWSALIEEYKEDITPSTFGYHGFH